MSTVNANDARADRGRDDMHDDIRAIETGWALFPGVGALTILAGVALIASSFRLDNATGGVFGWILLAAAVAQLVGSYFSRRWVGSVVALMNGVFYGGIAITLFADRSAEVGGVMLAVVGLMIAAAVARAGLSAVRRYTQREIHLFTGALGLMAGLMVAAAWYGGQLWAIGFILGIDVIVIGVAWVLFAAVLRRVQEADGRPRAAR